MMMLSLILISQTTVEPMYQVLLFVDFTKSMNWKGNGDYRPLRNFFEFYARAARNIFAGNYMATYIIATNSEWPILLSEVKPSNEIIIFGEIGYDQCVDFVDISSSKVKFKETTGEEGSICWHTSEFLGKEYPFKIFIEQFRNKRDYGSPVSKALEEACNVISSNKFKRNIVIFYSDMIEEDRGSRIVPLNKLKMRVDSILNLCSSDSSIEFYIVRDVSVVGNRKKYVRRYQHYWVRWLRVKGKATLVSLKDVENTLINIRKEQERKVIK